MATIQVNTAIRSDREILKDEDGNQIGILTILTYEGSGYVRLTLLNDTKALRMYNLSSHPVLMAGRKRPVKLMFATSLEPGSIMHYSFEGTSLSELDNLEYLEWLTKND